MVHVKCPECGQIMAFQERPGYQNMILMCPRCRFKARANIFIPCVQRPPQHHQRPYPGAPYPGGNGNGNGETEIFHTPKSASSVGQIRVKATGEIQYLHMGNNVIGRRANSGSADIKISNDEYMSRRHINIRVIKTSYGCEHHLAELFSTNAPLVNGRRIAKGDVIRLRFGDVITIGQTEIILETEDMDATRLI